MGRPRINDEAVKERLLHAATEMLATRPHEAISVRAVAAAAGAATAAVYTLFGSKDGLIEEVRSRAVSGLCRALGDVPATTSALNDICALAVEYRQWALGQRHLYSVLFGGTQTFKPSGPIGAGDPVRPLIDAITRGLETSALAGDATTIALSVWVTLHGIVALELAGAIEAATAEFILTATLHATLRGWATGDTLRALRTADADSTPPGQDNESALPVAPRTP